MYEKRQTFYNTNRRIILFLTFLDNLSSSNPTYRDALDIGRQAEMYAHEENFKIAIEKYKSALTLLVPLLNSEPPGHRKTLLHEIVST